MFHNHGAAGLGDGAGDNGADTTAVDATQQAYLDAVEHQHAPSQGNEYDGAQPDVGAAQGIVGGRRSRNGLCDDAWGRCVQADLQGVVRPTFSGPPCTV